MLAIHAPPVSSTQSLWPPMNKRFLARGDLDGPHGIVRAAKRELFAIRRPACAIDRVKRERFDSSSFFAATSQIWISPMRRAAAGDGDFLPSGDHASFLDALRESTSRATMLLPSAL